MSTFKFAVMFRKKITINTDPQRRNYNGCNFSEKTMWSEWGHIVDLPTHEAADQLRRTNSLIPIGNTRWRSTSETHHPRTLDATLATLAAHA